MIKEITGDLIDLAKKGEFDVILHGSNCHHTMGSGIAKQIKFEVPEAFAVDLETPYGDINKLGTISYTKKHSFTVVNCYSQFRYGRNIQVYADYDAIERALTEVKKIFPSKRIGMPLIGAGLAGGDWNVIKVIIEKVFCDPDDDVTIVKWDQQNNISNTSHNQQNIHTTTQTTIHMSTTVHKFKGKRKCKFCHKIMPRKAMNNYIPGLWICKDDCHDKFAAIVNSMSLQNIAQNQSVTNLSTTPSLS